MTELYGQDRALQECNENLVCCIIDDQSCTIDADCCSDHCHADTQVPFHDTTDGYQSMVDMYTTGVSDTG